MIYQFRTDAGDIIEQHFSAASIPELGQRVHIRGVTATRILSLPVDQQVRKPKIDPLDATLHSGPRISRALPKYCEGAEHVEKGKNKGAPIIKNKPHERELCKRYDCVPARDAYDTKEFDGKGYHRGEKCHPNSLNPKSVPPLPAGIPQP